MEVRAVLCLQESLKRLQGRGRGGGISTMLSLAE